MDFRKFAAWFRFLVLVIVLYPNAKAFSQCDPCQTYGITVFNSDVKISAPDDPQLAAGYYYLRNQCVGTLKQSIKANDLNPDCIHIYDGSFVAGANGEGSMNSQNTAPTGSLPISSGSHYLIRSEVTESSGGFSISFFLETSRSREVVKSFARTFASLADVGISKTDVGKNAGFQGFSPLSMIIRSFETRKREENKDIAIDANAIEVLPHAKSIKKEDKVTVAFRLTDCDGEVLPGRKILLKGGSALGEVLPPSTLGEFSESEVVTDDSGVAKATFVAGKQKGKAILRVYYTYKAPFGEERYAKGEATIDIEGEPVTALIGEIEVNAMSRSGSPAISSPKTSRRSSQTFTVSSLDLTIIPERIKVVNESKEVLQRALTETDRFEVVTGKTLTDAAGEPSLVRAESNYSQYGLCEDKLEVVRSGRIKGYSNGYDISVGIALERGAETGNMTISSLSPRYCLVVRLGSNSRLLFQSNKYKTSGEDRGQKRDYPCADLTSFSESIDAKSILPFAGIDYTIKVNDQENQEFIVPLSIPGTEALEQYLLNPEGVYTISVNGSYRKKDNEEREVKITAKLTIWPKE